MGTGLNDLRTEMSALRTEMRTEMGALRTEMRTEMADLRRNATELQDQMHRRFEVADAKIDRDFTWLVGIQVAALVAVVGALVGSYYK